MIIDVTTRASDMPKTKATDTNGEYNPMMPLMPRERAKNDSECHDGCILEAEMIMDIDVMDSR